MKKYLKVLIIFILCLTFSITSVGAKSYIKDLFQAEDNLKIEEELSGTAFLAGTKVNVEKSINGVGFIAGETVTIQDKQEYIFAASTKINMEAEIENDLFIFTDIANITGNVNRDTYMFANTASLDGKFDRNVYIAGTSIELNGTFNGNVTINATEIEIADDTIIKGTLKYNSEATIDGLKDDIKTKTYEQTPSNISFTDYITTFINTYINITLVALIMVYMNEKIFKNLLKQNKDKNIFNICIKGLVILIGIPIISLMTLMTGLFTSVGVLSGIIYGILVYIANIFTAYYLATEIDKRYFKKNMNSYTLMIVGLLIIKTLSFIPIIGSIISFISLVYGLGVVCNMIIEAKK